MTENTNNNNNSDYIEYYILNADKTKLQNAKALEEGWSDWSNETWAKDIYQEFGTRPYWEDKTPSYK